MKNIFGSLKTKSFRVGGYSVAAALILIIILVLVNVVTGSLPAAYTEIDVSSQKLFSLSEESEKIVKNMEENVTIYWVALDSSKDSYVENLLSRYEALSDRIEVKYIDPDVYPTFGRNHNMETMSNNSVLVCGEKYGRERYISTLYEYEYDYSSFNYQTNSYNYTTSFNGENMVTSAINYVVNADLPVVYCSTGHGEKALSDAYLTMLTNVNMEVRELSLLTQAEIPEDCDILLMNGISSDISEDEKAMLLRYLENGGRLMLLTDPGTGTRTNLRAVMAEYGISEIDGIVVEGSADHYVPNPGPLFMLPEIREHEITEPTINAGYYLFAPIAGALQMDTGREDLNLTSLLRTSAAAYVKTNMDLSQESLNYEKEEGDIDGPVELGIISEKGEGETLSQVIWLSTIRFADDSANAMVAGANGDFFVNCMTYMSGQSDSIAIHSKELAYEFLQMTGMEANVWSVILAGILPVSLLASGIIIFVRRRRR